MAETPLDRRGFFQQGLGKLFGKAVEVVERRVAPGTHVRPPGALPEAAFLAACTRCGECTAACPVHAISPLGPDAGFAAGTPALRVELTACVMCLEMPCAAICPTDALAVPDDGWTRVKMARVDIHEGRCIAFHGTECGVCAQVCPAGGLAIRLDGDGRPRLGDRCTGCGTCIIACVTTPKSISAMPAGAIL
jgi:ferredoxin-type protein NapG